MKNLFIPANILLPKEPCTEWSVIACDQYTSDRSYWEKAEEIRKGKPSTLDLILPEVYLSDNKSERIKQINLNMDKYIADGVFKEYENCMIFVDRTLPSGKHRYGIVGALDLEEYDYTNTLHAKVRATEQTVLDRIPPRVEIRKDACIELPHVLMLIDDAKKSVIEPLIGKEMSVVYDYELMLGAGHIKGSLIPSEYIEKIEDALDTLAEGARDGFVIASGDGNHSLATAKECYKMSGEAEKRYALVELCNLQDSSLEFEPIYRVIFGAEKSEIISEMDAFFGENKAKTTQKVTLVDKSGESEYTIANPVSYLTVGSVEKFVQSYLKNHRSASVDYIHGKDEVKRLCAADNTVGFIFEGMAKDELFTTVIEDGVLPRKTFSMGEADSKRFYTECRIIRKTK